MADRYREVYEAFRWQVPPFGRIDPAVLHSALLDLVQSRGVFDEESSAPERMLQPVFVETVDEHSHCELSHSDFLQHGASRSGGTLVLS